eukprot:gb/GECH01013855.1/.p1 GENE.gb/GECH01013855.1/~~gb/GECH01013855.1/.p1  ORF type:complete len:436 (+),score=148.85 gb/GECH01013855.1/:1-1308(+)
MSKKRTRAESLAEELQQDDFTTTTTNNSAISELESNYFNQFINGDEEEDHHSDSDDPQEDSENEEENNQEKHNWDEIPEDMEQELRKEEKDKQDQKTETNERRAIRNVKALRRKINWNNLWNYSDDEIEEHEPTPKIPPEMRTVVVLNIPIHIEEPHLEKIFSKYGKVEKVKRSGFDYDQTLDLPFALKKKRHLYDPKFKTCKAKIQFASVQTAHMVKKKTGHKLHDRHVFMYMADRPLSFKNARSAFIGNLPFDIEAEELYEIFHLCGPIDAIQLGEDKETRNCNGTAFIKFAAKSGARNAFKLKKLEIRGRPIRVKKVKKDDDQPAVKKRKKMLEKQLEAQKEAIKKGDVDPSALPEINRTLGKNQDNDNDDDHDPLNMVFPWQGEKSDPTLQHDFRVKTKRNPKKQRQRAFREKLEKKHKHKSSRFQVKKKK